MPRPLAPPALALLLLLAACAGPSRCADGAAAPEPDAAAVASIGDTGVAPPSRLHSPPMLGPIDQRELQFTSAGPFRAMGPLELPRRPAAKGEWLTLWDALSSPVRLLVRGWGRGGEPHIRLIAPGQGVLARFEVPLELSAAAGVVGVRRDGDGGQEVALVRLEDGAMRVPRPQLAGGQEVERPLVFVHPDSPAVWLFGRRGADRKGWFGRFDPGAKEGEAVVLERALPFMPNFIRYNRGLDALEVERTLRASSPQAFEKLHEARMRRLERLSLEERPCGRVRIEADGETRCVTPELERHVTEDAIWLDGPWVSFDADLTGHRPRLGVPTVVHTGGQAPPVRLFRSLRRCRYVFRTGLERPPRLLAGCAPEGLEWVELRLWSPQGVRTLEAPADWAQGIWTRGEGFHALQGWPGRLQEPILRIGHRGEAVGSWLDLERGEAWRGPPVRPLRPDASPRRALAVGSGGEGGEGLVLLDFEAGTLESVGIPACPEGEFEEVGERRGRWALVACRRSAGLRTPRAETVWASLLDLEGRRRWEVLGEPLAGLEGGRVVLGRGAGAAGFRELWVSEPVGE